MSTPPATPEIAACGSCEAPIIWAISTAGARSPFDAEPVPEGTFWLTLNAGTNVVRANYVGADDLVEQPDRNRYRTHFATCPNADDHRRRR